MPNIRHFIDIMPNEKNAETLDAVPAKPMKKAVAANRIF
jgi:hypothetical protein